MITELKVTHEDLDALTLPITSALHNSPIVVRNVMGLTPNPATIGTYKSATRDGGRFSSARVQERNIVITLDLRADWAAGMSVEAIRHLLYDYFLPKNEVTIEVVREGRPNAFIEGYVEAFESDIFSIEPLAQISILCPDPRFRSAPQIHQFDLTSGLDTTEVVRLGSHSGFELRYSPAQNLTRFQLLAYNRERMTYEGPAIQSSETFLYSSVPGDRYIRKAPNGNLSNWTNIIEHTDAQPSQYVTNWLSLWGGTTILAQSTPSLSVHPVEIIIYDYYSGV